ncbi:MAG: Ca-activated chloride channel family protein [Planctomycetota bacterium]|jgi:Ca-activated chloride channel family protein
MNLGIIQGAINLEGTKSAAEGRLQIWGEFFLADPYFLLLIPAVVIGLSYGRSRKARAEARFSVLPSTPMPRSLAQRLSWVPFALQLLSLLFVVFALARPLRGDVETNSVAEGVDLALLVDRSSSMGHMDLEANRTRLDVVKDVVAEFATRRMTDREGASDFVALFSFARYPLELCPFTLDVDAVSGFLAGIELAQDRAEDGTGIGIALAKAVAVLRESDATSKVIVLLTDGENNLDLITPGEAAELAAEEGIRVYTVFAGSFVMDAFGRMREVDPEHDTAELQEIAKVTGGRFFRAKDRKELERAYFEIEELERTPREEQRFVEHFDLYPILLYLALAFYVGAWLCGATWARRLP